MYGLYVISGIIRMNIFDEGLEENYLQWTLFLECIFGPTGNPAVYTNVQKLLPRFCWSNLRKRSIRSNAYVTAL